MCNWDTEGHSKQKWAVELQGLLKSGALPMEEEVQLLNFKEKNGIGRCFVKWLAKCLFC